MPHRPVGGQVGALTHGPGRPPRERDPHADLHPALVNGMAGVVVTVAGRPFSVMGFTVADGRIAEIDAIADPERVRRIAAAVLG